MREDKWRVPAASWGRGKLDGGSFRRQGRAVRQLLLAGAAPLQGQHGAPCSAVQKKRWRLSGGARGPGEEDGRVKVLRGSSPRRKIEEDGVGAASFGEQMAAAWGLFEGVF